MSPFEAAVLNLHAQVDDHLGDRIFYSFEGAPETEVNAHVLLLVDNGGADGIQPARRRRQLKILKSYFPSGAPSQRDRIRANPISPRTVNKLDGLTYRPGASTPASAGDYWLFDIQKAS